MDNELPNIEDIKKGMSDEAMDELTNGKEDDSDRIETEPREHIEP